jgi:hypothetical protein
MQEFRTYVVKYLSWQKEKWKKKEQGFYTEGIFSVSLIFLGMVKSIWQEGQALMWVSRSYVIWNC